MDIKQTNRQIQNSITMSIHSMDKCVKFVTKLTKKNKVIEILK